MRKLAFDGLIVGGGGAGLRAALELAQSGLKTASGKLVTPTEVAWALCAGADFAVSARGFMFALGCIQAMRCNKNTCPTGITTHNPRLQRGLNPPSKAVSVANYQRRVEEELKIIAHSCGVAEPHLLRREHCRIVRPDGQSVPLSELYPKAA